MINFEKILKDSSGINKDEDNNRIYYLHEVLRSMRKLYNQTIDLCNDNIVDEEDKELQQCVESIRDNLSSLKLDNL